MTIDQELINLEKRIDDKFAAMLHNSDDKFASLTDKIKENVIALNTRIDKLEYRMIGSQEKLTESVQNLNQKFSQIQVFQSEVNNLKDEVNISKNTIDGAVSVTNNHEKRVSVLESKLEDINWLKKMLMGTIATALIGGGYLGYNQNSKESESLSLQRKQMEVLTQMAESMTRNKKDAD